jgi:hypothetical protein
VGAASYIEEQTKSTSGGSTIGLSDGQIICSMVGIFFVIAYNRECRVLVECGGKV